jgi:hypothetical protein
MKSTNKKKVLKLIKKILKTPIGSRVDLGTKSRELTLQQMDYMQHLPKWE